MQNACGGWQPHKETLPEHLARLWRLDGGGTDLQLKNTFIDVVRMDESKLKQLKRSKSWSGCRNIKQDNRCESSRCSLAGPTSGSSNGVSKADGSSQSTTVYAVSNADLEQHDTASSGWSEGAGLHNLGDRIQCRQLLSAPGYTLGEDGQPWHVMRSNSDDDNSYIRPCKAVRNRCKRIIEKVAELYKDDPASKLQALTSLIAKYPYARKLVKFVLCPSNGMATQPSAVKTLW
eukprot:TRINITY_DN9623_c0_g2_i1.p1 TRINITY_DN9623_c0_g2~~TRINITY_DN9623_c0_g2_i1.p1  ORF type:complete len:233 (-),score=42.70 TRINITY_DN9623_c0_g2_i1:260-958(-)